MAGFLGCLHLGKACVGKTNICDHARRSCLFIFINAQRSNQRYLVRTLDRARQKKKNLLVQFIAEEKTWNKSLGHGLWNPSSP